jgi:hypothetical protein
VSIVLKTRLRHPFCSHGAFRLLLVLQVEPGLYKQELSKDIRELAVACLMGMQSLLMGTSAWTYVRLAGLAASEAV